MGGMTTLHNTLPHAMPSNLGMSDALGQLYCYENYTQSTRS